MAEWVKTSERLPEPGVPVIAAYRNPLGKWRRIRAVWIAEKMLEADEDEWWPHIESLYYEEDDGPWCPPGWYEECESYDVSRQVDGEVVMWTPLPPLPPHEPEAPND